MNTFARLALILGLSIFAVGCGSGSSSNKARGSEGGDNSSFDDDAAPFFNQGGDGGGAGGDGLLPLNCQDLCDVNPVGAVAQLTVDICDNAGIGTPSTEPCQDGGALADLPVDACAALPTTSPVPPPAPQFNACQACVDAVGSGTCPTAPAQTSAQASSNSPTVRALQAGVPALNGADLGAAVRALLVAISEMESAAVADAASAALNSVALDGVIVNAENAIAELQNIQSLLNEVASNNASRPAPEYLMRGISLVIDGLSARLEGDAAGQQAARDQLYAELSDPLKL